ncbi:MAG: hypothetical protein NWF01_00145 [Candidatus Bathyarchaeota archaeon]|nr:hypothetical protein [Candidatus Bathyarchaeota archaeon]
MKKKLQKHRRALKNRLVKCVIQKTPSVAAGGLLQHFGSNRQEKHIHSPKPKRVFQRCTGDSYTAVDIFDMEAK